MKNAQKVGLGLIAAIIVGSGIMYVKGYGIEATDDAQIEGHIVNISSRLSGQVANVLVSDNQFVHKGDLLLELDKEEVKAHVDAAEAELLEAEAALNVGQSDVSSSSARLKLSEIELNRVSKLYKEGVLAKAELDSANSRFDQAKADYEQSMARLGSNAPTGASGVGVARLKKARAMFELAKINLSYTEIKSPVDGIVSKKSVEAGQVIHAASPLLAIVAVDDIWIVANYKEDQISNMKIGQKAKITVDAFNHEEFDAEISSFGAATGSKFALIPPDNATGNFVKVTQRLPVLFHLAAKPQSLDGFGLRPGMSAVVKVITK